MAATYILGRVQGASIFYTTQSSSATATISSLQPSDITPFVGDHIIFRNGDLREIKSITASSQGTPASASCGSVLVNLMGDDGVSITDVSQTTTSTTDGGYNIVTIKKSDGSSSTIRIQNGTKGTAAGFGTPTASVDSGIGTPSVSVSASGADTAKVFDFKFKNLKGVGISSVTQTATSTADGGTNTMKVTLTNGNSTYFNVRNGSKGSTGATGATGPQGPKGEDGTDGANGVTFTPIVSEDGVLTWTNDGGLTNPEALKIKGDKGLQYNTIFETENPEDISDDVLELPLSGFNRTPIVDEAFLLFSWITSEEQLNIAEFTVQNISDEKAVCLINSDTLRQINGSDGVGITEIIGGDAEVTRGETITPITIKTSDGEERQVEIVATNGTTNVVAYTMSVEPIEWKASTEYADLGYNFYATISIGADKLDYPYDTYIPTITPTDIADILGDNLAPFAVSGASSDSGELGVYVYAKEQPTTTKTFNVVLSHVIE